MQRPCDPMKPQKEPIKFINNTTTTRLRGEMRRVWKGLLKSNVRRRWQTRKLNSEHRKSRKRCWNCNVTWGRGGRWDTGEGHPVTSQDDSARLRVFGSLFHCNSIINTLFLPQWPQMKSSPGWVWASRLWWVFLGSSSQPNQQVISLWEFISPVFGGTENLMPWG